MYMCKSIVILLNDFSGTGVPRVSLRLAEGLNELGHKVDIVVLNPFGPMREQVSISVRVVPLNVSRAIMAFPKLSAYLREHTPDCVIAAEDQLGVLAAVACLVSRSRARLLVTSHVPYSCTGLAKGLKGRAFVIALRLLWNRIDIFSTVSAGLADDMTAVTKLPRNEITVLHNAVVRECDISREPDPSIHPFFLSGSKVILGIGSLHRRKGFHDLIEAVRLVLKSEDVRLIILGEGRERESLQRQIIADGLDARVDLAGYCDNPFPFLQTADVFVLPSYFEGLPTVLIEALACGCPSVATDCVAGPNEILKYGEYGKLVQVGNREAMADAIIETLYTPISPAILHQRATDFTANTISRQAVELL